MIKFQRAGFMVCWMSMITASVAVASDVRIGVTISGEVVPGVYGRVDIGDVQPPLLYAEPVVIMRPRHLPPPVYLHVPPGHARQWRRFCARYDACSRPVYFVRSAEYDPGYRPEARRAEESRGHGDHGHHHSHDHDD